MYNISKRYAKTFLALHLDLRLLIYPIGVLHNTYLLNISNKYYEYRVKNFLSKISKCEYLQYLFTGLIEEGYHSTNPYHNAIHATDVTQAMHCFLQEDKVRNNQTRIWFIKIITFYNILYYNYYSIKCFIRISFGLLVFFGILFTIAEFIVFINPTKEHRLRKPIIRSCLSSFSRNASVSTEFPQMRLCVYSLV